MCCRASVAERYDVSVTTTGYERVYRSAIGTDRRHPTCTTATVSETVGLLALPLGTN